MFSLRSMCLAAAKATFDLLTTPSDEQNCIALLLFLCSVMLKNFSWNGEKVLLGISSPLRSPMLFLIRCRRCCRHFNRHYRSASEGISEEELLRNCAIYKVDACVRCSTMRGSAGAFAGYNGVTDDPPCLGCQGKGVPGSQ